MGKSRNNGEEGHLEEITSEDIFEQEQPFDEGTATDLIPPKKGGGGRKVLIGGLIVSVAVILLLVVIVIAGAAYIFGRAARNGAGKPVGSQTAATDAFSGEDPPLVVLKRDAEEAVTLARSKEFSGAFGLVDSFETTLDVMEADVQSERELLALEEASVVAEEARKEVTAHLAAWAEPVYKRAASTFWRATEPVNDDEDLIIQSYVELSPVLPWKKHLPQDLRKKVENLAWECKDNLDDEEWAQARWLAKNRKG